MSTTWNDDGTLRSWLMFARRIDRLATRSERIAHVERVRLAIGAHTDRLVRWNTGVCDSLDVSITMAPRA